MVIVLCSVVIVLLILLMILLSVVKVLLSVVNCNGQLSVMMVPLGAMLILLVLLGRLSDGTIEFNLPISDVIVLLMVVNLLSVMM